MTYQQAIDSLPAGAVWSSSFGYPGEAGCREYFRTPDGKRYIVGNGDWRALPPFTWTVHEDPGPTPAMMRAMRQL